MEWITTQCVHNTHTQMRAKCMTRWNYFLLFFHFVFVHVFSQRLSELHMEKLLNANLAIWTCSVPNTRHHTQTHMHSHHTTTKTESRLHNSISLKNKRKFHFDFLRKTVQKSMNQTLCGLVCCSQYNSFRFGPRMKENLHA